MRGARVKALRREFMGQHGRAPLSARFAITGTQMVPVYKDGTETEFQETMPKSLVSRTLRALWSPWRKTQMYATRPVNQVEIRQPSEWRRVKRQWQRLRSGR